MSPRSGQKKIAQGASPGTHDDERTKPAEAGDRISGSMIFILWQIPLA
jgi:hypothetical protein